MHPAIQGALVGVAIGFVLVFVEYSMLKKNAREKAARLHRPEEWGDLERNRVNTVLRFSLILPFAFAGGFWLLMD